MKGVILVGILSGIFKSRDKPQNATSGSAYRFFIGGSSSGKNVNERSAMQMTAVYSCVRILSEAVASLPLHVYKYNGDGGKEKAVKNDWEDKLSDSFYRCHRGYLVNLEKITAYSVDTIDLINGDSLILAQKKYSDFIKAYMRYAKDGGTTNV